MWTKINQNMRRLDLANSVSYPLKPRVGSSHQGKERGLQEGHLNAAAFLVMSSSNLLLKTDFLKNYHGNTYRFIPHFSKVIHSTSPVFHHGK